MTSYKLVTRMLLTSWSGYWKFKRQGRQQRTTASGQYSAEYGLQIRAQNTASCTAYNGLRQHAASKSGLASAGLRTQIRRPGWLQGRRKRKTAAGKAGQIQIKQRTAANAQIQRQQQSQGRQIRKGGKLQRARATIQSKREHTKDWHGSKEHRIKLSWS